MRSKSRSLNGNNLCLPHLRQHICINQSITRSLNASPPHKFRFIMYHKGAIEGYPLQAYTSALLFSPTGSLIRQLYEHEEPKAISVKPILSEGWSACLQTLEGHSR